jgi:hypothetical protein
MSVELRHYCRNLKCRSKLPAPIENVRKAFCCRGCHSAFYRTRCLVCEKEAVMNAPAPPTSFYTSAENALVDPRLRGRAAHSAVDALMYSLRRGIEAITEPDNQRRLAELSEDQLLAVCQRLQNFKPNIAPAWPPEEVEALASIWSTVHVSR